MISKPPAGCSWHALALSDDHRTWIRPHVYAYWHAEELEVETCLGGVGDDVVYYVALPDDPLEREALLRSAHVLQALRDGREVIT